MSRPPLNPDKSVAGIAMDPQTLERVIPESRRPDGSLRKQIKVRPGFTPQEDVRRFRGTRQAQMDTNALPKGHIIGWVPPPAPSASTAKPLSKSAKKNAKRRVKKEETREVPDNWDDEEEEEESANGVSGTKGLSAASSVAEKEKGKIDSGAEQTPNWALAPEPSTTSAETSAVDTLASKVEKLTV
ncbi:hypothetical protein Hypma_010274 [Hypsizygus marmoreus]|uniref:WIBG Mago-binding domain-containing protein n=1 Tax=Hypsizygus marmoreus TaxID=39966 RepID=A0A369JKY3_HYPMA|nr:hypothetical protein Hypma_010274 [Hypsizygus marmoreus]